MRSAAFKALLALVAFPLMAFPAFADVVIGSSPEGNGGLAPCDSDFAEYTAEVDRPIDRLVHGHVIAAYTEQPSFTPEWGARIIEDSGRYRLLVARFKASVWYSAYREIRPHRFERDLALPPQDLAVDEIALSDDTAARLAAIITHEVDSQQAANKQMGLDGESHTFRDMHGHCASAWSPDADTRAFALVDVFHSLQFEAALFSRPLQYAREQYVNLKLRELSGEPVTSNTYLILLSCLGMLALIAGLPLLIAALTLLFPNRPTRKGWFIIWSGIVSYGLTGLLGVALIPCIITGARVLFFVIPAHPLGGDALLASLFDSAPGALALGWLLFSVAVPIYLRRRGWARWGDRPAVDAR